MKNIAVIGSGIAGLTAFIFAGIYWQALRIWMKHIPYVPYTKEST